MTSQLNGSEVTCSVSSESTASVFAFRASLRFFTPYDVALPELFAGHELCAPIGGTRVGPTFALFLNVIFYNDSVMYTIASHTTKSLITIALFKILCNS